MHEGDVVILCPGAAGDVEGWRPECGSLRRVRLQMLETEPPRIVVILESWGTRIQLPAVSAFEPALRATR